LLVHLSFDVKSEHLYLSFDMESEHLYLLVFLWYCRYCPIFMILIIEYFIQYFIIEYFSRYCL